ncbi:elongation factor Ts, mitochondrial isoform X2 [Ischnura elegans]|uniref:elongation factor Ts, mitochondrial isoform X2 n=1 Tax=Ischnura elegans TaxID=197161 RepID=UPI001ED8AB44|nr:elongation factor Ts, mitochondrial isoform X2 [Ischnura elegans]
MMIRYFHCGRICWANLNKSLLAKLRKKTGYTFANCKKALELHSNDLAKAESWLREQAQAQGWEKATKLEGRPTSQGLVAVLVDVAGRNGSMVEVNCETDFVARNRAFQSVVEGISEACLKFIQGAPTSTIHPFTKVNLDVDQLKQLPSAKGSSLADEVALAIHTVGENIVIRRAVGFKAKEEDSDLFLSGYIHPTPLNNLVLGTPLLGRYGALVVLKDGKNHDKRELLGRQLCQHIVGMNPRKVGGEGDEPAKNPEDEHCLLLQEYLLDPSTTVGSYLTENGLSVLDFTRFECGEENGDLGKIPENTAVKATN